MKSSISYGLICLGTIVMTTTLSQSAEAEKHNCVWAHKHEYLARPSHAAMATTGGKSYSSYDITCGDSWGYPTVAQAKAEAIRRCAHGKVKVHYPGRCSVILSK